MIAFHALVARRPTTVAVVGALVISWAAVFVRLADVSVSTSATARCAFAVPVLALLAWLEVRSRPRPDHRATGLASVAGIGIAGRLLGWHAAIPLVGVGAATVLQDLQAVFVPIVAWLVLRERIERSQLAALPLVLVGAVFVAGLVGSGAVGSDPALGTAYGLTAAVGYTLYQLASGRATKRSGLPIRTLLVATTVSAALTGAWGIVDGSLGFPSGDSLGWLLALALVVQVFGWTLITMAMLHLPVSMIAIVLLLQPAGSVLLGAIIFDEVPSFAQFAGIALMVAAIVLAARPRPRSRADLID